MMSLVVNMIGFLALLLLVNVPAGLLGLEFGGDGPSPASLAPPGWLVVAAWLILFPAMGYARWSVLEAGGPPGLGVAIILLGVLCASYAYYTLGLAQFTGISALWFGLIGNGVVILFALFLAMQAWPVSTGAGIALAAVAVWTAFASISVVQELLLQ
ncbi:tryptophan-rich sensory protein [uncultured Marivita sp.]|uniref:tryptophan-rich sensory protein n=1 Tax=uncultured Marivita sp. TaxID=888080 RepID=UPI00261D1E5F|nr:tryptophan-rich sensory protein [uncultured Marivita sp.]